VTNFQKTPPQPNRLIGGISTEKFRERTNGFVGHKGPHVCPSLGRGLENTEFFLSGVLCGVASDGFGISFRPPLGSVFCTLFISSKRRPFCVFFRVEFQNSHHVGRRSVLHPSTPHFLGFGPYCCLPSPGNPEQGRFGMSRSGGPAK